MAPNIAAPRAPRGSGGQLLLLCPGAWSLWGGSRGCGALPPLHQLPAAQGSCSVSILLAGTGSWGAWAGAQGALQLPELCRDAALGSLASLKRFWQASLWTERQVLDRPPKLAGLLTSEECQQARWTSSIVPYSHGDTRQIAFYKYVIIHRLWLQLWPSWVWLCVSNHQFKVIKRYILFRYLFFLSEYIEEF